MVCAKTESIVFQVHFEFFDTEFQEKIDKCNKFKTDIFSITNKRFAIISPSDGVFGQCYSEASGASQPTVLNNLNDNQLELLQLELKR